MTARKARPAGAQARPTASEDTLHTLFGAPHSGSAIAEFALQRCGLAFRQVRAATWEPDSALDELARFNPLQQIPTLVLPDGSVLTESAAILIHLGLAHPDSGLLPGDSSTRAQHLRGLVFIAANCYSAVSVIDNAAQWTLSTHGPSIAKVGQAARKQLHHHWDIFADSFAPPASGFYAGAAPGALDIMAAVVSKWSGTRQHLAHSRPSLLALLKRIEAHAGVRELFARHFGA